MKVEIENNGSNSANAGFANIDTVRFRLFVGDLIAAHLPIHGVEMMVAIRACAAIRKQTFVDTGLFVSSEHPEFMKLLGIMLNKEDAAWADLLLITYYKSYLVDKILNSDDWILDPLEDLYVCAAELEAKQNRPLLSAQPEQ